MPPTAWTQFSLFETWFVNVPNVNLLQLFEKVVVLNELHGQSDAFCAAVKQLGSRWKLVCLALPHLIHCCSIALNYRDKLRGCGSTTRLPPASTSSLSYQQVAENSFTS